MGDIIVEQALSPDDLKFLTTVSKKLTVDVLCDVLKNYANANQVKLQGINLGVNNFKKGDSYLSSLFRFVVIGTVKDSSGERLVKAPVVVKAIPKNVARRKTFRSDEFFETEINFYTKVWPKLLEFQKEKNTIVFNNVPRCLAAVCDGINDVILLEDISPQNFKALGRDIRIDLEHILLVLRMFARLHAVSIAFKDQHPEEYEQIAVHLKETYYAERLRGWYKKFLENLAVVWIDALEKEVPGSIYEQKFKELIENDCYGQITKLIEDKGKYAVVSQGDTWLPNFMFQYIDNNPKSVYLVDFQLARSSSFVTDISFFLYSCVDASIRRAHWDEFLTEYHKTFTTNLEKLGSNPELLTFKDLQNEFLKYGKFGLGMCLEATPFAVMPDEDTADLDSMEGDSVVDITTVWKVKKILSKEKRMILVDIVKEQVDRGFL